MKNLDVMAAILVVIGALNWGLVGIFSFDLVASIFGDSSLFTRLIYTVVGIAALYQGIQWKAIQRRWQTT